MMSFLNKITEVEEKSAKLKKAAAEKKASKLRRRKSRRLQSKRRLQEKPLVVLGVKLPEVLQQQGEW